MSKAPETSVIILDEDLAASHTRAGAELLAALQADLVKDGGHHYFIKYLEGGEGISPDSRAQAAFVLAVICDGYSRGRLLCAEQGLLPKLLGLLAKMVRAPWALSCAFIICGWTDVFFAALFGLPGFTPLLEPAASLGGNKCAHRSCHLVFPSHIHGTCRSPPFCLTPVSLPFVGSLAGAFLPHPYLRAWPEFCIHAIAEE